jgi:Fe-S cluster biogenesis protein NfuA
MSERTRLDDQAVAQRLTWLEETLGKLEELSGPTAQTALDAVAALTEVYGEALARVLDATAADPGLSTTLVGDRLLGHLLVLHEIHPEPVEGRIRRALHDLDPELRSHGVTADLDGVEDGVARIVLTGGCPSALGPLRRTVEEAVRAIAPEVESVEPMRAPVRRPAAFIPADALLARRASAAGGGP